MAGLHAGQGSKPLGRICHLEALSEAQGVFEPPKSNMSLEEARRFMTSKNAETTIAGCSSGSDTRPKCLFCDGETVVSGDIKKLFPWGQHHIHDFHDFGQVSHTKRPD